MSLLFNEMSKHLTFHTFIFNILIKNNLTNMINMNNAKKLCFLSLF